MLPSEIKSSLLIASIYSFWMLRIFLIFLTQFLFIYFLMELLASIIALIVYFIGFNYLEASLSSLVSKLAPIQRRGLALGVYNTSQSLGIFVGGSLAGLIAGFYGYQGAFLFCSLPIIIWLFLSISMKMPFRKKIKLIKSLRYEKVIII